MEGTILVTGTGAGYRRAMPQNGAGHQTITGVERALDVLSLFAGEGVRTLGVTEIAEALGISKAVVHRILSSFRVKGYIEYDEDSRRYRLGSKILTLGLSYLDRLDVQEEARDALRELSRRTGETATLSVRTGWNRVYVDQVTPPRDIKMVVQLGSSFPLHAGASSKALLAFLPTELQDAYVSRGPLEQLTDLTVVDEQTLRGQLVEIRERGYAVSLGERQAGAGSVAAPIIAHDGTAVAVVSVCGPVERFRDEVDGCAEALLDVTGAVSRTLGYRGQLARA
jgi:IclR family transcriptional regulator, acetate operon repressor